MKMSLKIARKVVLCPATTNKRSFYSFILPYFNRVDHNRVSEVGPDRACAEWLLKNGASFKYAHSDTVYTDYNNLGSTVQRSLKIKEADGTDSSIMHSGFPHFKQCERFEKLTLKNSKYIYDEAMSSVKVAAKDKLIWLEVNNCPGVTHIGLMQLCHMEKLRHLHLENLPLVKNPLKILKELQNALPNCRITFPPHTDSEVD